MGGSSPLARGLQGMCRKETFVLRIIPARAGFTDYSLLHWARKRDHPRSRGVYDEHGLYVEKGEGSSPLARGLRRGRILRGDRIRIIPARAGFTWRSSCCATASRDHPRSRGVYAATHKRPPVLAGSSPLARGLPWPHSPHPGGTRIIPARAGFTPHLTTARPGRWDHPRSRGVYVSAFGSVTTEMGSSPLARGLQIGHHVDRNTTRIIPARAGFTRAEFPSSHRAGDHPRSRGVYIQSDGGF